MKIPFFGSSKKEAPQISGDYNVFNDLIQMRPEFDDVPPVIRSTVSKLVWEPPRGVKGKKLVNHIMKQLKQMPEFQELPKKVQESVGFGVNDEVHGW